MPPPTPAKDITVDLEIDQDIGNGCLLICTPQDGSFGGDSWHETIADAEKAAELKYGVRPSQWQAIDDDA